MVAFVPTMWNVSMKATIFSRRKSIQVTERFGALNHLKLMVTQLLVRVLQGMISQIGVILHPTM
jgi:hypothetical protein